MLKLGYTHSQKKRASTQLSLALSELEAAETLVEKGLFREALIHMYFSCFYTSKGFLVGQLKSNASHKNVEAQLHKRYGRAKGFPRQYIDLHKALHSMRNEYSYHATFSPNPQTMRRKLGVLRKYVRFSERNLPKIVTTDLLHSLLEENAESIKDFSFDIYCPKTYRHHVRLTLWLPTAYVDVITGIILAQRSRRFLKNLKVPRSQDYVVGLNSKVNQYSDHHLLLLDIDSLDVAVESALSKVGGVLLKSGRGFHFIGNKVIKGQKQWLRMMSRLNRQASLKPYLDQDHIDISRQRGYSTLRITASSAKPVTPVFYKEIVSE